MNYDKHEMKGIQFDENDVFTGNESGSVVEDEEYNPWSIKPDRSDSQEISTMYEKHQLDIISFDKTDVFVDEHSSGDGEGYFRNKPEVSDI